MLPSRFVLIFACGLFAGCTTIETRPAGSTAGPDGPTFDIANVNVRPAPVSQPPPEYPDKLRKAGVEGRVVVDFVVGSDGVTHNVRSLQATNDALAPAAIAAVRRWRFSPGMVDGQRVNTHLQVPILFALDNASVPVAAPAGGQSAEPAAIYNLNEVDSRPVPMRQPPPTYPYALRRAGVQGGAVVTFVVTARGTVSNAEVIEASEPEFGDAALACVGQWQFKPAKRNSAPVGCRMRVPIYFTLHAE